MKNIKHFKKLSIVQLGVKLRRVPWLNWNVGTLLQLNLPEVLEHTVGTGARYVSRHLVVQL